MQNKISLCEEITIQALHHLARKDLNQKENEALYGVCYRLHGHDYRIRITVKDEISPETGEIKSKKLLRDSIQSLLIKPYHGTYLNDFFPSTSGEYLCYAFYKILQKALGANLTSVAIQETRKNWFEYTE